MGLNKNPGIFLVVTGLQIRPDRVLRGPPGRGWDEPQHGQLGLAPAPLRRTKRQRRHDKVVAATQGQPEEVCRRRHQADPLARGTPPDRETWSQGILGGITLILPTIHQ